MKKHLTVLLVVSTLFFPIVTRAAEACPTTPANLKDLICNAMELVNPIIGLLTGFAVLYFIWNVVKFIMNAADTKAREAAKDGIVYGIIGLFVLFSFWGLVELLWASVFT